MVLSPIFNTNIDAVRHDLNRRYYGVPTVGQARLGAMAAQTGAISFVPRANVAETAEATLITVELPGVELGQLSLEIRGNYLVLSGFRHPGGQLGNSFAIYQWTEGRFGSFRWICPLPVNVHPGQIQATFANGLLSIVLPKATAELGYMANGVMAASAPATPVVITPGVQA